MRALLLLAMLGKLHLDLGASFTYGLGGFHAFGTMVQLDGNAQVWSRGSIEIGLAFGYQNEPQSVKPWPSPETKLEDHRTHLWLTVGHVFHLLKSRALRFGIFLFTGWSHYETRATLRLPKYDIESTSGGGFDASSTGAGFKLQYFFTPRVGASLQMAAPFPYAPAPVVSYFHVGLGLLVNLR